MTRRDPLRHLREHGCQFVREGGEHSIWQNQPRTAVPRSRVIGKSKITPPSESASSLVFLRPLESFHGGFSLFHVEARGCPSTLPTEPGVMLPRVMLPGFSLVEPVSNRRIAKTIADWPVICCTELG